MVESSLGSACKRRLFVEGNGGEEEKEVENSGKDVEDWRRGVRDGW